MAESKDKENDSAGDERRSSPGHGHRPGLDQMPVIQRVYYYNDNKPSCPVHGHGATPTSIEERPRSLSSGPGSIEPGHGPKPDGPEDPRIYGAKAEHPDGLGRLYGRIPDHAEEIGRMFGNKPEGPEEFKRLYGHKPEDHGRMFFHRHPDVQMLHPYLMHHSPRERPFPGHPMDEQQQAEAVRENRRQVECLFQTGLFWSSGSWGRQGGRGRGWLIPSITSNFQNYNTLFLYTFCSFLVNSLNFIYFFKGTCKVIEIQNFC